MTTILATMDKKALNNCIFIYRSQMAPAGIDFARWPTAATLVYRGVVSVNFARKYSKVSAHVKHEKIMNSLVSELMYETKNVFRTKENGEWVHTEEEQFKTIIKNRVKNLKQSWTKARAGRNEGQDLIPETYVSSLTEGDDVLVDLPREPHMAKYKFDSIIHPGYVWIQYNCRRSNDLVKVSLNMCRWPESGIRSQRRTRTRTNCYMPTLYNERPSARR